MRADPFFPGPALHPARARTVLRREARDGGGFGAKAPTNLDPDYDVPLRLVPLASGCVLKVSTQGRTEPVRVNCELGAMPHGDVHP